MVLIMNWYTVFCVHVPLLATEMGNIIRFLIFILSPFLIPKIENTNKRDGKYATEFHSGNREHKRYFDIC